MAPYYETEKNSTVHNDGGNEINEYTAVASKPQRSTTKKKRSTKPTKEELLNKWPSPQECVDYLLSHNVRIKHSYQLAELERRHREHFSEWSFLLKTNHSLLLYGYGSKRQLLHNFSEKLSEEGHYVANIQGYQ
jgi:origin recognition complex subunit 2